LLYSPRWLFLYPGAAMMMAGLILGARLLVGPIRIGDVVLDIHTLLYSAIAVVIGFQAIIFSIFTRVFACNEGLLPESIHLKSVVRFINLEAGLVVGIALVVAGLAASVYEVSTWSAGSFGPLEPTKTLRVIIPAVTALALGCQIVLSSFFLSVLALKRR
ncbi:MAG TPA: glycosyltransferase family 2 protein, partial [Blastocatellia bacterium]|nr:glycosyltransferase family 2 protein [Blastocatellia bacterium]